VVSAGPTDVPVPDVVSVAPTSVPVPVADVVSAGPTDVPVPDVVSVAPTSVPVPMAVPVVALRQAPEPQTSVPVPAVVSTGSTDVPVPVPPAEAVSTSSVVSVVPTGVPVADVVSTGSTSVPVPTGSTTGRALLRAAASTIIPTSGLLGVKRRRVLAIVVTTAVAALFILVAGLALFDRTALLAFALHPIVTKGAAFALAGLAVLWVINIVGTFRASRPKAAHPVGIIGVVVLSLLASGGLGIGALYAAKANAAIGAVFDTKSTTRPADGSPWPARVNVLLVGLDAGGDTDTIMVASMDTATGATVLIQVPRNLARVPFPAGTDLSKYYPRGFYDGQNASNPEFFIGALWRKVPYNHPDVFRSSTYPGAEALKLALSTALGIPVDYFLALDLAGIGAVVDAMGGVSVNVNFDVSIGGTATNGCRTSEYVKQGADQHLNGVQAAWFARNSCSDPLGEYGRMIRQACLATAIVNQADPLQLLGASSVLKTDIPRARLSAFAELAAKVKTAKFTRLAFITGENGFAATNPNFDLMRVRVQQAIPAAPGGGSPTSSPSTPVGSYTPPDDMAGVGAYKPLR